MKKPNMKNFVNEDFERRWWFNMNYCFLGTTFVVVLCLFLYATVWSHGMPKINLRGQTWDATLKFNGIIAGWVNSFGHASWTHVIANMVLFTLCGLYFERKMGTLPWLLLIPALAFFTAGATGLNSQSTGGVGYSGVNYCLFAMLLVHYIVSFERDFRRKNKLNLILGAVVIVVTAFSMFNTGSERDFGFLWYPYGLTNNMGHYSSFLVGLVIIAAYYVARITKKSN